MAGLCEYDNETPVSVEDGEYVDHLKDHQILRNNSGTCT
jgi:hypothetical protein